MSSTGKHSPRSAERYDDRVDGIGAAVPGARSGDRARHRTRRIGYCDHCGEEIPLDALTTAGHTPSVGEAEAGARSSSDADTEVRAGDKKLFCCNGCRVVYELLHENDLCEYYAISSRPGVSPGLHQQYDYLDDDALQLKLLEFRSADSCAVTLTLPQMHCSSCVWLLEHLHRLDGGIIRSRADFLKKTLAIQYDPARSSLRRVVELLASLGYAPELTLDGSCRDAARIAEARSLYYKIGIAGFCFGNIMLLSFPEYLSRGGVDTELRRIFTFTGALLALPVVCYCASGYFLSAWRGLKHAAITLDVPIALGIGVVFLRSLAEIATGSGAGYLDSLAGLVLFLLLGRLFQNKAYDRLQFDRRYGSYFPIAITVIRNGVESPVPLDRLAPGDRIRARNGEIIPADSYLLSASASIDYSFVTGEARAVTVQCGALVYAGGRVCGSMIELETAKDVSQSYLTQLWNADVYTDKQPGRMTAVTDAVGRSFTIVVLLVAALTGAWWWRFDPSRAMNAVTGILIIACPCALALSSPVTLGTVMRILGRNRCYVKNTAVIESLAGVDTLVFDKTGTLTQAESGAVHFVGTPLTPDELASVVSLARQSTHPMSRMVASLHGEADRVELHAYSETPGEGISGAVGATALRFGSCAYAGGMEDASRDPGESRAYLSVNGMMRGYFAIGARYRTGIGRMFTTLGKRYRLALLSGDNDSEAGALRAICDGFEDMRFLQSPMDKLQFVQALQSAQRSVAMVGDGLNDAGALRQGDVGIAVTDDTGTFSPACDVILEGAALARLPALLSFARSGMHIVFLSFALSFLYNIVGCFFAVQGTMSPVIAAILMPLSSTTVVLVATMATRAAAHQRGLVS